MKRKNEKTKKMEPKKKKWIIIICAAVAAVAVFVLVNIGPFMSMSPADTGRINDTGIIAVKKWNSHRIYD